MIETRTAWLLSALLILPGSGTSPAQDQPKPKSAEPKALLTVKGEVEQPLELAAAGFAKLPRHTVHAKDHDGKEADYEGVALVEVLRVAGVKFGQDLRGKRRELSGRRGLRRLSCCLRPPRARPRVQRARSCSPTEGTRNRSTRDTALCKSSCPVKNATAVGAPGLRTKIGNAKGGRLGRGFTIKACRSSPRST